MNAGIWVSCVGDQQWHPFGVATQSSACSAQHAVWLGLHIKCQETPLNEKNHTPGLPRRKRRPWGVLDCRPIHSLLRWILPCTKPLHVERELCSPTVATVSSTRKSPREPPSTKEHVEHVRGINIICIHLSRSIIIGPIVVLAFLHWVREHRICFPNILEQHLCLLLLLIGAASQFVRVELESLLTVRSLDLPLISITRDPQDFVVVLALGPLEEDFGLAKFRLCLL
mmetsp:Transcript_63418/g.113159  ORF Transcript_63418/g.113159 Transcript_63418/m.113159 type:complete len:227 (-) Transcript_63418:1151-1831(-)